MPRLGNSAEGRDICEFCPVDLVRGDGYFTLFIVFTLHVINNNLPRLVCTCQKRTSATAGEAGELARAGEALKLAQEEPREGEGAVQDDEVVEARGDGEEGLGEGGSGLRQNLGLPLYHPLN